MKKDLFGALRELLDKLERLKNQDWMWTLLCRIKHYAPILLADSHVKEGDLGAIKFHPGPHLDEKDKIWKEFILVASSSCILEGIRNIYQYFTKYHAPEVRWEEKYEMLYKKIKDFIQEKRPWENGDVSDF